MLQRKLLMTLFPLVGLLMALAVAALIALQSVFADLDRMRTSDMVAVERTHRLSATLADLELQLHDVTIGRTETLASVARSADLAQELVASLEGQHLAHEPASEPVYLDLAEHLTALRRGIQGLSASPPEGPMAERLRPLLSAAAVPLREEAVSLTRYAQGHVQGEQEAITRRFRWVVIALAAAFLVVINASFLLLLRAAGMILRPVGELVEASRKLAAERFEYRVAVGEEDEFAELGRAFNSLAEQLQANEKRRLETLAQAAVTLNHHLNNAIATIELQLNLLKRQSGGNQQFERRLRQIHENLHRMAAVVESLKHIRRIVLTDYLPGGPGASGRPGLPGVKMLDLEGSVREAEPEPASAATALVGAASGGSAGPGDPGKGPSVVILPVDPAQLSAVAGAEKR